MMLQKINYPKPKDILPHNKPMLLVDEIESFEFGESLKASAKFDSSCYFFQGHFDGNPIVPGVILVESMFQTCGLYLRLCAEKGGYNNVLGRAIKIKEASFLKEVKPNEELNILVQYKYRLMHFYIFECYIQVNDKVVCKGELVLA
jgi:3-hydroxyacyl-[acyl-carrier-protein] dehydratase